MSEIPAKPPVPPTIEAPTQPPAGSSKRTLFKNLLSDAKVRLLYEELLKLSFPVEIRIGSRELGDKIGCDKDTVNEIRKELVRRGWVQYRVENQQAVYRLMFPEPK